MRAALIWIADLWNQRLRVDRTSFIFRRPLDHPKTLRPNISLICISLRTYFSGFFPCRRLLIYNYYQPIPANTKMHGMGNKMRGILSLRRKNQHDEFQDTKRITEERKHSEASTSGFSNEHTLAAYQVWLPRLRSWLTITFTCSS